MKRIFDIGLSLVLMVLLSPVMLGLFLVMVLKRDLPVFYVSERMRDLDTPFSLIKLRTMRPPRPGEVNSGVSGGAKNHRITPLGRKLRRYRLDEIPQLWNILRGDMSFVGPRPPLRRYTEMYRELYADVLRSKPGVTGLASLVIHRQEGDALAKAQSAEEIEEIYTRRFIPRKARLDLIYQANANLCYDVVLLWQTLVRVAGGRRRAADARRGRR
ncbi:sugar transferase [Gymnodinialimonas sp. 202GB13-11]